MERKFEFIVCPKCNSKGTVIRINPKWLQRRRARANLTQREVGEMAGVARPSIAQMESGHRPVPEHVLTVYEEIA